ncbi:alpha/beta hydrolase [Paenibacillus sp. FSL W8-0426]|uniref:alpha/beta fold hydrolase n=1 Tax=Paenibacillus sp. FSL W8-0426 TaxID=2921714 RepID=UPI0030D8D1B1
MASRRSKTKKAAWLVVLALILISVVALVFPTWTPGIEGERSISTLEQIEINGSKHRIMIRGHDRDNPVIIFVHGGPGSSEIAYAASFQNLWEQHFTVVNYDQRASGASYHFFENYDDLSSKVLVEDLLAITDHVSERLGQDKVILIGHSYGTYVAAQAAQQAPEKYTAYIGIGQLGNATESEIDALEYVINEARRVGDEGNVQRLEQMSEEIRKGTALTPRSYVTKYGGASSSGEMPDGNVFDMIMGSEYNLLDIIRYYVGILSHQQVLLDEVFDTPLSTAVTELDLPVYFVMGKYDYMTSSAAARTYFDQLNAKQKQFIAYENSAHFPHIEEKDRFSEWMITTFAEN